MRDKWTIALTLAGMATMAVAIGTAMTHSKAHADADANRVITRAQWIDAAEARFDRLDLNKDGKLDASELANRRHHGGPVPEPVPSK